MRGLNPQALVDANFVGSVPSPLQTQVFLKAELNTRSPVSDVLLCQRQRLQRRTVTLGRQIRRGDRANWERRCPRRHGCGWRRCKRD